MLEVVKATRRNLRSHWTVLVKNRGLQAAVRRVLPGERASPGFFIIGAMKSGTSSLYRYLVQHPEVVPALRKEVHYFDLNFKRKDRAWFQAHFPLCSAIDSSQMTGEATPLYLFHPEVPGRLHSCYPRAKLIVLLRDPAERAISHYFHEVRSGRETLPLREALEAEEERLAPFADSRDFNHPDFIHFSYRRRGLYLEQLRRYWALFPEENLLVLNSREFFSDPHSSLMAVFNHLEIDDSFVVPDLKPAKVGTGKCTDGAVVDDLREFFEEPNALLYRELEERSPYSFSPF